MRQQIKIRLATYIAMDFLTASLSWAALFFFRKYAIEDFNNFSDFVTHLDSNFYIGIIIIPLCWLFLYFLSGSYSDIYRMSRIAELNRTLAASVIGCTIIFFSLILDDYVTSYRDYYQSYLFLFGTHLFITAVGRILILNRAKRQLERGAVGYNTLMIGGGQRAVKLFRELTEREKSLGYRFMGYLQSNGQESNPLDSHLNNLGSLSQLSEVLDNREIDEVIIAIENAEHELLNNILAELVSKDVVVKIRADIYDIISGSVKMNHVLGAILIEIYPEMMPKWQKVIKRSLDVVISFLVLIFLSWFYAAIALRVRLSSDGPIFYSQERLGLNRKPFRIYKFRSMFVNSEPNGPLLSTENDNRITDWGRFMRKWRFDELPQFYNVLRGDMSLVGPRPERAYYISKITEEAPAYNHLSKVKPGLTSWGMVKFGYASNVGEMIQRMKYDLLYIENMSLAIDLKIILYTVLIILQGKGK